MPGRAWEKGKKESQALRPALDDPGTCAVGRWAVCATAARCSAENEGRGLGVASLPDLKCRIVIRPETLLQRDE